MSDRDDQGAEVLRSLPSRRPQRRSARRDAAKPPAKPAAKRPAAKVKAPGKPKTTFPKAAAPKAASKPRGVRPSAATDAASSTPGDPPAKPPEGVELVGTAIQAAGELAQLGLTLGTKALRGAVRRIPRP
ncbi:MAG TPA: hypothetical protein VNB64_04865 [Solirubrobacteraceae bacterium]|nr:hypothetical protein [Solirubrobacteraceae bacterium]